MTCIHPSVDNENRPKVEEISQGANAVNVVQNEDSVLICFFFVLPSAPISPRIQLNGIGSWEWSVWEKKEDPCVQHGLRTQKEGRNCGSRRSWVSKATVGKEGHMAGRIASGERLPPQQDSVVTCQNLCECMAWGCWHETNRLPDIPPVKMGLFRISRELQFKVCNYDEPHASSPDSKARRALL